MDAMIKKVSKKVKILIAVCVAVVLCTAAATALTLAFSRQYNLVFKGHSTSVSLSRERKKDFYIGLSSAIADDKPYMSDSEAMFYLRQLVYQPLVKINNDGTLEYKNASKIIFTDNGAQAKVTLNSKIKFSNGEKLSADAVIDSYNFFINHETDYNGLLNNVASMEKADDKTVIFHFKAPNIDNIKIFNIPVVLFDDSSSYALGTGRYKVDSIVYYGDMILLKNEYSKEKAKYKRVLLRPMDYTTVSSLNEIQNFDVFLFNKGSQSDAIKDSKAYNIYEMSEDYGSYLLYNTDNASLKNAVSSLVSTKEFFEATQDNSVYSEGMLFAYMKKPNYHSMLKDGSFSGVKGISVAYGYEGGAHSVYLALSDSLESLGVICTPAMLDLYETQESVDSDIVIYNGRFKEILSSDDSEKFFQKFDDMNCEDYYFNLEKYFADKNEITPLAKESVWYASLAGRDNLGLFD